MLIEFVVNPLFFGLFSMLSAFSWKLLSGFCRFLVNIFMSAKFNLKQAPVFIGHQNRIRSDHSNFRLQILTRFSSWSLASLCRCCCFFFNWWRIGVLVRQSLENDLQFKFNLCSFFADFIYNLILDLFFLFRFRLSSLWVRLLSLGVNFLFFFNFILWQFEVHQICFEFGKIIHKLGFQLERATFNVHLSMTLFQTMLELPFINHIQILIRSFMFSNLRKLSLSMHNAFDYISVIVRTIVE